MRAAVSSTRRASQGAIVSSAEVRRQCSCRGDRLGWQRQAEWRVHPAALRRRQNSTPATVRTEPSRSVTQSQRHRAVTLQSSRAVRVASVGRGGGGGRTPRLVKATRAAARASGSTLRAYQAPSVTKYQYKAPMA